MKIDTSSAFLRFPLPSPRLVLGFSLASSAEIAAAGFAASTSDETTPPSPVSYKNSVSGIKTRLYEVDCTNTSKSSNLSFSNLNFAVSFPIPSNSRT